MATILPLFLGKIGPTELVLIIVVFVIFFGGRKIPELMRGVGRGMKEFQDAMKKDYSSELDLDSELPKASEQKKIEDSN